MDRHMAYVAFSRHRDRLTVYAPQDGFREPLAVALSRSGAKSTTLDHQSQAFVARRGFDTAADWVAAFAHRIADAREQLTALWARAETAFARNVPAIDQTSTPPVVATPSLRDRLFDAVRSTFVTTSARDNRSAERHSKTAARRHLKQDTTMNDMTPLADNPRTSHSKLTVDGNTARVEYPYDKDANTTFKAATSKLKPEFNKASGAYEIALSSDADERKFQLATIETARMQINGRLKELAVSQGFAKEIADGYQTTGNVEVSARNGALAVKIPPAREAIDTLKQAGGTWIPQQGENGNYWRVEISNATDRNRVRQALSAVEGQVAAWGKSSELAKGIASPHEEISLSTSGAKLFVSTPHMTETNRLLKSEAGGAEMKWDGRASAYAITVTADNVEVIKDRLSAVAAFYETQCLIPPHKGMPGIAMLTDDEAVLLGTKATGQTYASDKAVEAVVDKFADRISKALSDEDRRELASMNPNQPGYDAAKPIASERLAALPKPALEELASLAATVRTARSEGVQQQLAQARDQVPAQGQGPTR